MALGDFFRINMPYGMKSNDKGEWFVFNREYKPLGWNTFMQVHEEEYPVWVKYKGLTEQKLLQLADKHVGSVSRDKNGKICSVFFYSGSDTPKDNPKLWSEYSERLKILSNLSAAETSDVFRITNFVRRLERHKFSKVIDTLSDYSNNADLYFKSVDEKRYLIFNHYNKGKIELLQGFDCWISIYDDVKDIGKKRPIKVEEVRLGFNFDRDWHLIEGYLD